MTKVLNTILVAFFAFFAAFCWVYYVTKLASTSLACGGVMAFAVICLASTKKLPKKTANKKIAKQLALQFALYGDNGVVVELYQFVGYDVDKRDEGCIVTKDQAKALLALDYCTKGTGCDKVLALCRQALLLGCNQLHLWCKSVDADTSKYLDLLPVKLQIFDAGKAVALLQRYEKMPNLAVKKTPNNTPVLQYAFNKKRTKSYLTCSAFTFALAFLSYFPLYNLVWASLFALAGLYSRFNRRFNLAEQNIKL